MREKAVPEGVPKSSVFAEFVHSPNQSAPIEEAAADHEHPSPVEWAIARVPFYSAHLLCRRIRVRLLLHSALARSANSELFIVHDLFLGELRHVVPLVPSAIPRHRALQRRFDSEPWFPSEFDAGLAGIKPENMILVHAGNRIADPRPSVAPHLHEFGRYALDWPNVLIARSEVVGRSELRMLREECLSQHQVTVQRLEHVLPGTDGIGTPDYNRLPGEESADQIRNEPVLGPVTAANDIAGARRSQAHMVFMQSVDWKELATVCRDDNFGAGFAGSIRVVPTKRIRLTIRPDPFLILVTLVSRDAHDCAHARSLADRLRQMHRTHDVRAVCAYRVGIRAPNDRLCCQMKDDFRIKLRHRGVELGIIAHVAANIINDCSHGREIEHVGFGARVESVPSNLRAQSIQPEREPTALETGVTG